MTDMERIERLESVLETAIAWIGQSSVRVISRDNAIELIRRLNDVPEKKEMGDG